MGDAQWLVRVRGNWRSCHLPFRIRDSILVRAYLQPARFNLLLFHNQRAESHTKAKAGGERRGREWMELQAQGHCQSLKSGMMEERKRPD